MSVRLNLSKDSVRSGAPIEDVGDALRISSNSKATRRDLYLYRGQSDESWPLRPAVFRYARWFRHERDMIRDLISTHPQEFSDDTLMLDRLVRMQHYGLPTRLLDVTQNFLVSLYFACGEDRANPNSDGGVFSIRTPSSLRKYYDSDAVSLLSNLCLLSESEKYSLIEDSPENHTIPDDDYFNLFPATDRLLQFVRDEKPYFRSKALKSDLLSTFFVIPKKSNRRIIAQSGAFLIFGLVDRHRFPDLRLFEVVRHTVPNSKKSHILEQLEGLGITEGSLFPEVDRASAYIAQKYRDA